MATITTALWQEEPEPANAYAARVARCRGYDVYGQMLGRAGWADMVFLLFTGEAPTPVQRALLESLAVALANPGPRDPAIHAAMCGGVSGSPSAACLTAALAVGAGGAGGAREVHRAVGAWLAARGEPGPLVMELARVVAEPAIETWPAAEVWPGFDAHSPVCPLPVQQTLDHLAAASPGAALPTLRHARPQLEAGAGRGLAMTGVAAAAYVDLGLDADSAEMLHLLLRLPGAAAHALEQRKLGFKKFPFGELECLDDPYQRVAQSAGQESA
jgi:citrate synthase